MWPNHFTRKSRIFTLCNLRTLPAFTVGNSAISVCTQYVYLGAPVRIPSATPVRQRVHPIVHDLLTRMQQRLTPLKWFLNNATGISIPVARTIYTTFIRSVVDYLSPALVQLSKATLEPLDKFQNTVMRLILGCAMSTRRLNMLSELHLPPLIERIHSNVTYFTAKRLHFPHFSPHYLQVIRTSHVSTAARWPRSHQNCLISAATSGHQCSCGQLIPSTSASTLDAANSGSPLHSPL